MQSQYVPVLQGFARQPLFDLESLVDRNGMLEIQLAEQSGRKLRLLFDDHVAYRKLDEGDALSTLRQVEATSSLGRSFYRVDKSEFVDWFCAQSCGVRNPGDFLHLLVMTVDDVIDVICTKEPAVVED